MLVALIWIDSCQGCVGQGGFTRECRGRAHWNIFFSIMLCELNRAITDQEFLIIIATIFFTIIIPKITEYEGNTEFEIIF